MPKTQQINFRSGDGSDWTGKIKNVERSRLFGSRVNTSDPKWILTKTGGDKKPNEDKFSYISLDGSIWWARVRAHSEFGSDHANYDFLLWPEDADNPIGQHVKYSMVFQTWDGLFQQILRVYEEDDELYMDVEPYSP